jgi:hypothetical protein
LKRRILDFEKIRNKKSDNPVHDIIGSKINASDKEHLALKEKLLKSEQQIKSLSGQLETLQKDQKQTLNEKAVSEKEIARLNKQLENLQQKNKRLKEQKDMVPVPDESDKIIRLRPTPQKLDEEDVKKMLQHHDFYCGEYNWSKNFCHPQGKGIRHDYKVQKGGKVIVDRTTGLMWEQSGSANSMVYEDTKDYIDKLNRDKFAGFDDWRMPTLEEAMSLMESKQQNNNLFIDDKFDSKQDWIWTADEVPGKPRAWVVFFNSGDCYHSHVDYDKLFVRCVRSGQASGR